MPRGLLILPWVAALAAAQPASAQVLAQAVPVKYDLPVTPGEILTREIVLSNQGNETVVVRLRYSDWQVSAEGAVSLAAAGSTPNSLAGHVRFEPQSISLPPGEEGRVLLTMSLPADGPATRYGVVLSEVRPAVFPRNRLGPRAIAELGTTIYLSRIPADRIRAEFTALVAAPLGGDSMAVSARVRNAGERHLYVTGEMALADSSGVTVRSAALGTGVALPGTKRAFTWTCAPALAPGRYRLTATLDTGEAELLVGERWIQWPLAPTTPKLAERLQH